MMRYSTIERHVTAWANTDKAPCPPGEMARIFRGMDEAVKNAFSSGMPEHEYNRYRDLLIESYNHLSRLLPCRYYSLYLLRDVCVTSATKEGLDKLRENDEWKDRPILLGKMQGKPYELLDGNHRLYLWHEIGDNVRVPAVVIPGDFRL